MASADREGLREARQNEVTIDMLAAAWEVVRDRYPQGRVLGPGPGFREAIAAALARRPLCDLEVRIVEAETSAEVDRQFAETSRQQAEAAQADIARLSADNDRLRERLEIKWAYDGAGNRIPFPKGMEHLDGIECRDETIKGLEEQAARLSAEVERVLADITRMDALRLMAGEMTAQEGRTALAVAKGIAFKVRTALAAGQDKTGGGDA